MLLIFGLPHGQRNGGWEKQLFSTCYPTGELKDIKQDISRLRYELLDRRKRGVNPLAELVGQLDEVA